MLGSKCEHCGEISPWHKKSCPEGVSINNLRASLASVTKERDALRDLVREAVDRKECPWCWKATRSGEHDSGCSGFRALSLSRPPERME